MYHVYHMYRLIGWSIGYRKKKSPMTSEEEASGCGKDWHMMSTGDIRKKEPNEYSEIHPETEEEVQEVINPATNRIGKLSLPPLDLLLVESLAHFCMFFVMYV